MRREILWNKQFFCYPQGITFLKIMQLSFAGWGILSIFLVSRFRLVLPGNWAPFISTAVYVLSFVYYQATAAELYVKLSA